MNMTTNLIDFIHQTEYTQLPDDVLHHARRALLDLLGVAVAGTSTKLSTIIRNYALEQHAAGSLSTPIVFDGRKCSISGAALAGGMSIDSVDAHDGHKLTKGHVGCGVLPALLGFSYHKKNLSEKEFLTSLVIGYEIGVRSGIALHKTACDYHTSGAWVALAVAAVGSRLLHLTEEQTREALGIAEYHGPRSQMMRCIDHPTMVKDGSGWGAMTGVSAALLARDGFTGAPAITMEGEDVNDIWSDLGSTWRMTEQYMKPYPVCRWAQPGIIAVLSLQQRFDFTHEDIDTVEIGTFHESARLATARPLTTEQAQYSLPFPVAAALVCGTVGVNEIEGEGLRNETVLQLSSKIKMVEVEDYNDAFPSRRFSHVIVGLKNGQTLDSGATEADGDPESPLSDDLIEQKFDRFAQTGLSARRIKNIKRIICSFGEREHLDELYKNIYTPCELPERTD